jgi:adenosylcobinamide-phosphate synthase
MSDRFATLAWALACDQLLPELPNRLHPVVWMGRSLALGERLAPRGPRARLAWGAAWFAVGLGLSAGLARSAERGGRHWIVRGALAQTLLAYRALDRAAGEVEAALRRGDLAAARRLLGWHLVSRPTAELSASDVAAAAIESLAENLADSVVAPLFWCAVGGLPALAAYRCANTADAMWGYLTPRHAELGRAAARTDDLLNLIPARLTAAVLALAARPDHANSWRVARRDHGLTASPNAGWPMAAMAGALDTTLSKIGHYSLGDGPRQPDARMLHAARRIVRRAVLGLGAALLAAAVTEFSTQSAETRRRRNN